MTTIIMDLPDRGPIYAVDADDIQNLLQGYPKLTTYGMNNKQGKAELTSPDAIAQINHCIAFLASFTLIQTPNAGSYGLKHLAEKAGSDLTSYIYNGALIAAGLILGIPHSMGAGPNVDFAISEPERRWVQSGGVKPHKGARIRKPLHWDEFLAYRDAAG